MPSNFRPEMSDTGLDPTKAVTAVDEYQNVLEMHIADERPLTIYLDRHEIVTLMTLGNFPELLTLGYIKNQGLISKLTEIKSVHVDWDVNAAAISTFSENLSWKEYIGPRIITTGCGQGTVYGNVMEQLENICLKPTRIKQSTIYQLLRNLNEYNDVYKNAGAVHGCALCKGPEILCFVEDVGRHNAVDTIAGKMWLDDIQGQDKLFYTTGRLTSEMVIKVAQMGIPALLSRSGITQMGLKLAQDLGVTLFSRAKGKHFLIYHGQEYVDFDVTLPQQAPVKNISN